MFKYLAKALFWGKERCLPFQGGVFREGFHCTANLHVYNTSGIQIPCPVLYMQWLKCVYVYLVLQHPTPVQMQAIPCILGGRDVIVLAETVSVFHFRYPCPGPAGLCVLSTPILNIHSVYSVAFLMSCVSSGARRPFHHGILLWVKHDLKLKLLPTYVYSDYVEKLLPIF